MQASDVRQKSDKEILDLLEEMLKTLEKTSIEILKGKEKNVKKAAETRKDIARIKTVINERKILQEE